MKRIKIKPLLCAKTSLGAVCVKGWVKTRRDAKGFSFIEINDGSCLANLQVIADAAMADYEKIKTLSTGSAISVIGKMTPSPGKEQAWELQAETSHIYNIAP